MSVSSYHPCPYCSKRFEKFVSLMHHVSGNHPKELRRERLDLGGEI